MNKPDYFLIIPVATLVLLGILIVASVSASLSLAKFGSPTFYLFHYLIYGLMPGVLLGFAAYKIPLSFLKKWLPILLLANLFLLVLVFIPKVGMTFGGARSWINFFGLFSFQPSEFLKLSFLLYLASFLSVRTEKKKSPSTTLIVFSTVLILISLLLILQPDIGTLGIIIISAAFVYFLAGTPLKHIFIIGSVAIASLALLIQVAPYRLARILVFINPNIDPMGISYQIKQALIAVGSGGIFGRGVGMSIQKYGFLPQPLADSIFAVFSEEWGFVGSFVLLALFFIFAWRGFAIAKRSQNKFYRLAVLGITCWITLQAFVNMGSMVGILPLTGIPLPFISYGGSALIAELIGIGILLNISKNA